MLHQNDMFSIASEVSQGSTNDLRIAWLMPTAGIYWQPILSEFARRFPQTTVFTGLWNGFIQGFEDSFTIRQVGKMKSIGVVRQQKSYNPSFTYFSPKIISHLFRFKPNVVFSNAFSIWTILTLLLKPWHKWRVVIICDGSSPGVDFRGSWFRLFVRRTMAQFADAFITNTQAGKAYLTEVIKARKDSVFARPYLLPDLRALSQNIEDSQLSDLQLQRPIFLFVGGIMTRKGLHGLIEACSILQNQGYREYTLLIVGSGPQRQELEVFVKSHNLEDQIKWVGHIDYGHLGAYFQQSDIFVLPTLEDVWGLVVVEAMAFGKPVLCSKEAGAVEMVVDGESGYTFDPHNPKELAELMSRFINNPDLSKMMGEKSKQIMLNYALESVSKSLAEVVAFVLDGRQETIV